MRLNSSIIAARILVVSLAWGASASAQSFSLTPPCAPGLCGASRAGGVAWKPAGAVGDQQYIEVDVEATSLLRSSGEHIAISTFASGEPSTSTGAFGPNAPNGGIGIALGQLDSGAHPSCAADPYDTYVEFAIERFGWNNIWGSQILDCVSIHKTFFTGALRIGVLVNCEGTLCNASATVTGAASYWLLGSVGSVNIPLMNPTSVRQPWYAVTNFVADAAPAPHSASFTVRTEMYSYHF